MLCVNKLISLVFNVKKINAKTQFASFKRKKTKTKNKKKTKTKKQTQSWNKMHEYYAIQILETKKTKTKEQWS